MLKKVVWSESGEKSAQIKLNLQPKTALKYVGGFWYERQQEMDLFIGGSIITDYDLWYTRKQQFEVKIILLDLFLTARSF